MLFADFGNKFVTMNSHLDIERFNESNYEMWKLKMEDLLEERDKWIVVNNEKKDTYNYFR